MNFSKHFDLIFSAGDKSLIIITSFNKIIKDRKINDIFVKIKVDTKFKSLFYN